ncbi:MAG: DUF4388 domain-containing protein [Acidobacteriota bacterium]
MAHVLIVEKDRVLATAIEDRLRAAGHSIDLREAAEQLTAKPPAGSVGTIILGIDRGDEPRPEAVAQLLDQFAGRLPLIALSASEDREHRLAALKAGALEFMTKPVDLEELTLRVDRLAGSPDDIFEGNLATYAPWEILESLRYGRRTGVLRIQGTADGGRLTLEEGQIVEATWGALRDEQALLAAASASEGRFRFVAGEGASGKTPLASQEVLLRSRWMVDELERRRHWLPVTGAPLSRLRDEVPEELASHQDLPTEAILEHLRQAPESRIYDFLKALPYAPLAIRLATAWLAEEGCLEEPNSRLGEEAFPTTQALSSSLLLEVAVADLLATARDRGFDAQTVPYLVLFEPEVGEQLDGLFTNLPDTPENQAFHRLGRQLASRRSGSTTLEHESGTLSFHFKALSPAAKPQIEVVAPACAGIMIWLAQGNAEDSVRSAVRRLSGSGGKQPTGVVIAPTDEAQAAVRKLLVRARHWRSTPHPPRSLLAVLRLLRAET